VVNSVLIVLAACATALVVLRLARLVRDELARLRADSGVQLAERNAEVDRRLQALVETMDRRLGELDTKVDRRLESASRTSTALHERLGKMDEATAQMLDRAKDLGRLEQALRPPKARGGFGELLLANLLRDRLPPDAYELQYSFSTGERVDAVIRADRLIPVDAKFPLDNFERLIEAEDEAQRQLHERAFARDLKGHVDSIAAKYIRPGENTYDFALMYLPAEAVYYELVSGKTGALLQHAHSKRVFPVSPTTLYAQLQVIALGLKGLQIEQHAHEVMAYCAQLKSEFTRFRDDFELVGKHLGHAATKYAEAERRLDRFDTSLERASEREVLEAVAEPQPLPRALDAA
jgi:DNA recombination protein RmuC